MTADLQTRFVSFVRARKLMAPGDRVLAAVSGGIDSMVLLHLLKQCAAELQVELTAAHFDHAMREASAADAEWVQGVCAAWAVPIITARSQTALYGEAAARTARYSFLQEALRQSSSNKLATAHHADDQIETVLFRLMRGTGLRGLSGIPLRRGAIIRPLLRFRKSELQAYAAQHQIGFREDETNLSDVYTRNRIRRTLIPIIESIRPEAPRAILTLARHAARAERAWRSLLRQVEREVFLSASHDVIELAREKWLEYDAEIRARVLRDALRDFGTVPGRRATHKIVRFLETGSSGGKFDVGGGIRVERAYDVVRIKRMPAPNADQEVKIDSCSDGAANAKIGGRNWCVRWTTSPTANAGARFDCQTLQFPLTVRGWQPGDRMRMSYGSKKLKKLFAERRIPFNERASLPVLVDGNNRVLWIPGVARSSEPLMNESEALTVTVSNAEIG